MSVTRTTWKCRRCNAMFALIAGNASAATTLNGAINAPDEVHRLQVHHCDGKGWGVADLIGAVEETAN